MKALLFVLSVCGINLQQPQHFTFSERVFIRNVIKIAGKKPDDIYRLENNKIRLNYPDQRITLGQDGFIHDLEVLDNGKWIDLGPEY